MHALTKKQIEMLSILKEKPEIFSWMSRKGGKIVEAYGPPENWTVFQIKKIRRALDGTIAGYRTVSISADEHSYMRDEGLTKACEITKKGIKALEDASNES